MTAYLWLDRDPSQKERPHGEVIGASVEETTPPEAVVAVEEMQDPPMVESAPDQPRTHDTTVFIDARPGAAEPPAAAEPRPLLPSGVRERKTTPAQIAQRERSIQQLAKREQDRKEEARAWAKANGWEMKGRKPDGGDWEIMRLDANGEPVIYETDNEEARISHNVEPLTQFGSPGGPVNLSGFGWTAGMWESGPPRLTHTEFNDFPGRVVYGDSNPNDADSANDITDHGTHVLGTILGNGFSGSNDDTRGMAWRASARTFGWNGDDSEMRSNGATAPNQPSRIYVSNHSYGIGAGWFRTRTGPRAGTWGWSGSPGASEDDDFGRYSENAEDRDITCRMNPYYLPFFSAGNERGNVPPDGATIFINVPDGNGGFTEVQRTWPDAQAPAADGAGDGGYDTIRDNALSKNAMVVGNQQDAVLFVPGTGDIRFPAVSMSPSSSFGPADDGRIKPDIVGNGHEVLSAVSSGDEDRGVKTGTSMATPGATGTALLLHEHFRNRTNGYLRSSALKALMIHTATDVQSTGPDYASGWGLIDAVAAVAHIDLAADHPGGFHIYDGELSADEPEFRLTFQADGPVKATLVWTDPEGTEQFGIDNRSKILVNDLDVEIRRPNGSFVLAPELDPTSPTDLATYAGNDTDNVEMLGGAGNLIAQQAGVYELVIKHKGQITEPGLQPGETPRQVFSLMLEGNIEDDTGSVAQAVDLPERVFIKATTADVGFGFEDNASFNFGDRAVSLDINDSQKAGFQTTVTGPVTVTFDWGVSSESGFDFLRFLDDAVEVDAISGTVGTTQVAYNVPAGEHVLSWIYEKDSTVSVGDDAGFVDNISLNSLAEALDNFDFAFLEPGSSSAGWTIEPIDPTVVPGVPTGDIAKAGGVSGSQFSAMETFIEGPALVQFTMVQTGDGTLFAQWGPGLTRLITHNTGNAFRRYSIELGAGLQPVRWTWSNPNGGTDAGRVDSLVVTPLPGTLRTAANLPTSSSDLVIADPSQAAWQADASDGAPRGQDGEPDDSSIRSVFIPTGSFPGNTNVADIRYPVTGPCLLSFWWQCGGSADGEFSVDLRMDPLDPFVPAGGSEGPRKINPIPGGTPWQQVFLEIPPGIAELRFLYTPAANGAEGNGWIDQINVLSDPGVFLASQLHPARGLDHWSARWETYGDAPWFGIYDESNGGIDSTSHDDLDDNESTTLTTTVQGPKKLFFHWKVSSELGFDRLIFTLDGTEVVPPISGLVDWTPVEIDIPLGTHVLRWTYQKDGSVTNHEDRGWVDGVALLRPDFGINSISHTPGSGFALLSVSKDPTSGFFLESNATLDPDGWAPTGTAGTINNSGLIPPSLEDVTLIVPATGDRQFYRLVFHPEIVQQIDDASFDLVTTPAGFFQSNNASWGPDDDPFTATSFEHIAGFAADGDNHLSIKEGFFSEMKGSFIAYKGVHSVTAAIGHRSGFTAGNDRSAVVLTSGIELGRIEYFGNNIPGNTFVDAFPVSFDTFTGPDDANFAYKVRLESEGGRSFFDKIRVVSESQ
ncbi:S8 family serine peptidase [Haloferula rosea]|uniref:S8 family serine peptidase n=1 Tax=Haloferula rosea TaxID=490093 RepID=A0A934VH51_9BACT|nr:S8 family serine peptidase [Haloferula rosea]